MELLGELGDEMYLLNSADHRFPQRSHISVTNPLLSNKLTVTPLYITTVYISLHGFKSLDQPCGTTNLVNYRQWSARTSHSSCSSSDTLIRMTYHYHPSILSPRSQRSPWNVATVD